MREYLPAIDELISHYSTYGARAVPASKTPCPLCVVAESLTKEEGRRDCLEGNCPWVQYEGRVCFMRGYTWYTAGDRIKRLKRWRKLIIEGET